MGTRPAPVVGVGVVAVRPDGAVLLGRRISGPVPVWCLPGGHVEAGEDFERAALRELGEEAGVHGTAPRLFTVALDSPDGAVRVTGGVTAAVDGAAQASVREPEVFDSWIWADPAEPPAPLFPASAALLGSWTGRRPPDGWVLYPVSCDDSE